MKVLALVISIAGVGCSSTPPASKVLGAGSDALVARAEMLNRAVARQDFRAVQSLTAPEHTLNYPARDVFGLPPRAPYAPRGIWMGKVFPRLSKSSLEWTLLNARVYGNLGVVTLDYRWEGTLDHRFFTVDGRITDVWIRRNRAMESAHQYCRCPGS